MPDSQDFLFWTAAVAYMAHVLHAQRITTYWEREIQKYMPMDIPKQVFFPIWMIMVAADAGFAAMFFQNTTYDSYFTASIWVWMLAMPLLLLWNWFYFTPVSYYPAGILATLWWFCKIASLVLAILYGDTRAWVMGFIGLVIALGIFVVILSWFVTVKLGPNYVRMRDNVAGLTNATTESAKKAGGYTENSTVRGQYTYKAM